MTAAVGVALTAVALSWVAWLVLLRRAVPEATTVREVLAMIPQLLRLVSRLARDRAVPAAGRVRLWLALAYLASPVDLVPDVVPVIGYADDVVVALWALRAAVRRAGPEVLSRLWPGTPEGLALVRGWALSRSRPS